MIEGSAEDASVVARRMTRENETAVCAIQASCDSVADTKLEEDVVCRQETNQSDAHKGARASGFPARND